MDGKHRVWKVAIAIALPCPLEAASNIIVDFLKNIHSQPEIRLSWAVNIESFNVFFLQVNTSF